MTKDIIKKAHIEFYKSEDLDSIEVKCDIDFALSLRIGDIIWIDEAAKPSKFLFLDISQKELTYLSDGWYVFLSRRLLYGNELEIIMEEAHGGRSYFKKKFAHLTEQPTQ